MKIIIAIVLLCVIIYVTYGLLSTKIKIRCRKCGSSNMHKDDIRKQLIIIKGDIIPYWENITQEELKLLQRGIGSVCRCNDCGCYSFNA